jgi:hypothetical protein
MGDSMSTIINATTTNGVVIQPDNSGSLVLQTNSGTTALTIDTSQNVGIGTTSPGYKLDVQNGTGRIYNSTFPSLRIQNSSTGTGSNDGLLVEMSSSDALFVNYESANMIFKTADTERMRIDSSGNLLVGTTSSNARLSVSAPTGVAIDFRTTTTADPMYGIFNTGGSSGSAVYVLPCRFGSTQTFAGGVYWSGSVMQYTGTSDIRLKENIIDAGSGLDKLANIKVRSFDWKESGSHVDFGVIAQELEGIAPEAVAKGRDNEDGSINTPYAVDTSILVPAMIKAIQELTERVKALEAKLG